jgi:hypothetical protein
MVIDPDTVISTAGDVSDIYPIGPMLAGIL